MEPAVLGEPFDRRDGMTVRLYREQGARLHRVTVQEDRARTTVARVAAHVGAGEAQLISEEVDEEHTRFRGAGVLLPIHGEVDDVAPVFGRGLRTVRPPRPAFRSHPITSSSAPEQSPGHGA